MKLAKFLNQHDIILAVAERVNAKHPNAFGLCATMAKELCIQLRERGISARHVLGQFRLDQPTAEKYTQADSEPADEYLVDHDWVSVEGKILDVSARQFRQDVEEEIPDIVFIDHSHPLYLRYEELGEA